VISAKKIASLRFLAQKIIGDLAEHLVLVQKHFMSKLSKMMHKFIKTPDL